MSKNIFTLMMRVRSDLRFPIVEGTCMNSFCSVTVMTDRLVEYFHMKD